MKRVKKILGSKRGIAMESALIFIITIFSFCSLLTMLSVIGRNQLDIENILLTREVEVDQIGEDFLGDKLKEKLHPNANDITPPPGNLNEGYCKIDSEKYYRCKIEEIEEIKDGTCLRVYTGSVLLLYVEKDGGGNLVRWCYSEPPSAEQTTQQTTQQTTD